MPDRGYPCGRRVAILLVLAWGAAVAYSQPPSDGDLRVYPPADSASTLPSFGSHGDYLEQVSARSCPGGVTRQAPEAIEIRARPVPLQLLNPMRRTVGTLNFVAGFELTSPDVRFGGLSGLDLLDERNLLAVTDAGDLVWLELSDDGLTPVRARIARLRDDQGVPFDAKSQADAESVAVNNGVALISFEGAHRVLAYDVRACGSSARAVPVLDGREFADAFRRAGIQVGSNSGAEGLAVSPDWTLFLGLETRRGSASLVTARPIEEPPEFDLSVGQGAPELVGLDLLSAGSGGRSIRLFSLHRSSDVFARNAVTLVETYLDPEPAERAALYRHTGFVVRDTRVLAEMNILLTLDNFEGLAVKALPDGGIRLFIVSDDNFSASQRTLLMVFDLRSPV